MKTNYELVRDLEEAAFESPLGCSSVVHVCLVGSGIEYLQIEGVRCESSGPKDGMVVIDVKGLEEIDDVNKYHELMPDIWGHVSTLQIVQELKRRYPTELKMLLGVQELLETNRRIHPEQRETREAG